MRWIGRWRAARLLRRANRDLEEADALYEASAACRARAERRIAAAGQLLGPPSSASRLERLVGLGGLLPLGKRHRRPTSHA
ncbi:hypothetical protein [Methylobacterium sp. JK268]